MGKTYPLSEEFVDAFRDGIGTIHATCELCGRSYIGSRSNHFVVDCECLPETLGKFEAWIWNHGAKIAEYLRKRGERELKEAQDRAKAVTVGGAPS